MKHLLLSITGLLVFASLSAPVSAKDTVRLGTITVARGFCTPATDNTVGVKLDGVTSYAQWLAEFALMDQESVKRELLKKHKGNTLLADTEFAELKKAAARSQDVGVRRGQQSLCR